MATAAPVPSASTGLTGWLAGQVANLGAGAIDLVAGIGDVAIFALRTVGWIFARPQRRDVLIPNFYRIGVMSLPVVALTGLFIGMVLAVQSYAQFKALGLETRLGSVINLSLVRELGPVLAATMLAGRVGSAMAAELGTMRVTEQIDALETLATNPVKYLVVPRFLALVVMMPLLTIYADMIGIIGGYVVGVYKLGISHAMYMKNTWDPLKYKDIWTGLVKSLVFAIIICIVACYEGMKTEGGAEGVGRSTTSSVVISFILIIASDCFLTALFYFIGR